MTCFSGISPYGLLMINSLMPSMAVVGFAVCFKFNLEVTKMKKLLVALGFTFAAFGANANIVSGGLTVTGNAAVAIVPSTGDDGWGGNGSTLDTAIYTSGNSGTLVANAAGFFTATYLGQVAGFPNQYQSDTMSMGGTNLGVAVGTTLGQSVTAGSTVNFSFLDGGDASTFANGQSNSEFQGMIFLDAAIWNALHATAYDFLIGYNDTANVNADYDDYVVGVVNHVPVPAALPLMASALGMFGLSRRKSKKAA